MTPWSRRKRIAALAAHRLGFDAILVTHPVDIRWLCGFTGSNGAVALLCGVGARRARLFTDGRYTTQAAIEAQGTPTEITPRPAAIAASDWIVAAGARRCGFDDTHTSVAALNTTRQAIPAPLRRSFFAPAGPLIARLREVKDPEEIAIMRKAAALGCRIFDEILSVIEPGMAESRVAAELEYRARTAGAEGMSFDTIVASGERSALPHGRASSAKLPRRGFCTLDFGVVLGGYCSDMTRTIHLGKATPEEHRIYAAVLEAQEAGVAATRKGALTTDVDEAARSVLRTANLVQWFTHSTGHGVGLEIHESPRIAKKPAATPGNGTKPAHERLKSGMVVTIEPGVYLPGQFGVRIEDTVVVTPTGCDVLTPSTKAWIEL